MEKKSKISKNDKNNDGKRVLVARKKFDGGTHMEAIKRGVNSLENVNKFYLNISIKFKIAKYILIVLAFIFCFIMLSAFSSEITSEKFRYMIKDFDFSEMTSGANYDSLVFSGGNNAKFDLYRGDLAVVTPGSTAFFNSSGVQTFRQDNSFINPVIASSDKYMIVYDRGDTSCSYTLYNSFSSLKTENLGKSIYSAAVSNSGTYVILMRDDTSKGIIRIYDSELQAKYEIRKDKYTVCAAISSVGRDVYVASLSDQNGQIVTDIEIISDGKSKHLLTFSGRSVLSLKYINESRLAAMFTDGVMVFDTNGKIIYEAPFSSSLPSYAVFGDSFTCTVNNINSTGNDKNISVFDLDGKQIYSGSDSGELLSLEAEGRRVFLLFESRLTVIDVDSGETFSEEVAPNGKDILVTSDGIPLVCYSGAAKVVKLSK